MKEKTLNLRRRLALLSFCGMLGLALLAPSVFTQQGGPYNITKSVVGGGGGRSTNATTTIEGTIGQAILGSSSGGSFSLSGGFWQTEGPCAAPNITSQPAAETVCAGTLASFSVTATGTGLSFQWRKGGVNLTNGGAISGATTATLTINPAAGGDAGSYDVVISGGCGNATSNAATLSVNSYSLSSPSASFPSSGGSGGFDVLVASGCPWTAVSNDAWITINGGTSGSGNGSVSYSIAANPGGGRSGTITAAGLTHAVNQSSPTAIELVSFTASSTGDGVLLEWQTGREVDNLGFNLHRDNSGKLSLVNSQMLAASALTVGANVTLGSGMSYVWWDGSDTARGRHGDTANVMYWLESIDLNGASEWHGPFVAWASKASVNQTRIEQARTLASLASSQGKTRMVDTRAAVAPLSSSSSASGVIGETSSAKLLIRDTGWYRVTPTELITAGFDAQTDPRHLQVSVDGQQQPIRVTGEEDGSFDAADSVEFYGVGVDSPYSATRTYWLSAGKEPGKRIPVVQGPGKPGETGSFAYSVERRDRTIYFAALKNGEKENFFGAVVASQPVSQTIEINHLDSTATQASLTIALQGVTNLAHVVGVQLNGSPVGQVAFSGQEARETTVSVSPGMLNEGPNQVTLVSQNGAADVSLVDYVRVTYPRLCNTDGESITVTVTGGRQVTIEGFKESGIEVFDVTDASAAREIAGYVSKRGDGTFSVSVTVPGNGERALLARSTDQAERATIAMDRSSSLRDPMQGADLLIITRREFFASIEPLKQLRQSQGLAVSVVDIEDIYDEFSYGQKTPFAVREFVELASRSWKRPARYLLFAGGASYDTKNYLGFGESDLVMTKLIDTQFMESASDDWFGDFNRDGVSEIAIGRLPARTELEARLLISKLLDYEKRPAVGESLLVSDRNDGYDFERAIAELRILIPPGVGVTEVKRGQLSDERAREALFEALNRGPGLVGYSGHGSVNVWRGGLLANEDAAALTNAGQLSVFVMMNCLNGYFVEPWNLSLSETLLNAKGGAVAVWASSAMTFPNGQTEMTKDLYRQIFASRGIRLGEGVMRAKSATADRDVRRTWILFGDPTMRLK